MNLFALRRHRRLWSLSDVTVHLYVLVRKWDTILIYEQWWVLIAILVEGRVDELKEKFLTGILWAGSPPVIQVELKVVGDVECLRGAGWRNSHLCQALFALSWIITPSLHFLLKLSIHLELDVLTLLLTCLTCEVFLFCVWDCTILASFFARLVDLWNVPDLQSACLFDIRVVHANCHICYLTNFVEVLLDFYFDVCQFAATAAHSLWPFYRNVSERVDDDYALWWEDYRYWSTETWLIV